AESRLGRVADGVSDRLDAHGAGLIAHPGWRVEPPIPRVLRDVPRRVARLRGLGNAVVPEIPRRLGCALARALRAAPLAPTAPRAPFCGLATDALTCC